MMKINKETRERIMFWGSIAVVGLMSGLVVRHYQQIEVWVRDAGWWAPLLSMFLYIPLSLTPIPSDPLTFLNGAVFGLMGGVWISWMGNNMAAITEYYLSRKFSDITKFEQQKHKLPKFLSKWPADSPIFLIGIRLIPGFGSKVVSVMAGIYRVSWWRFVWTSALVNLLGSILWALGGWSLFKLI